MRRRAFRISVWLLIATGVVWPAACSRDSSQPASGMQKKTPVVRVEPAARASISRLLELTGEVVAVNSVVIASTVEGPVGFCPWREGDRVETSTDSPARLIEIDRELYRAEVKAAEAALGVARAKMADLEAGTRPEEIAKAHEAVRQLEEGAAFAKADYDRTATLVESGSLPGEAIEKCRVELRAEQAKLAAAQRHLEMLEAGYTKTAIAMQEAAVKEAQARLDLTKARLNECIIRAPFSGTITRVHVRPGDMAAVKAPLLEMADLSSQVIRVAIPEAHASAVHKGMVAHTTLDSLPGKTFAAKVARVYPELDRRMRTRTVELVLEESAELVPGMFARLRLVLASEAEAVTVSQQAISLTPAGEPVAYVVVDGKAAMRRVQAGIEQAGRVQILAGLDPGEKVVIAGYEKLKDGMEVRIAEPGKAPGAPAPTSGGLTRGGGAS